MINRDAIREQIASPRSTKSATSASSSPSPHLSSCGESDQDRYCSANSVLGTPSISSSITAFNDCAAASEFGSFHSSGFVIGLEDEFESFTLEGKQKTQSIRRIRTRKSGIREGDGELRNQGVELREDDGDSSRNEHSEGEESMYDCGTDDDSRSNVYYTKKHDETVEVGDNPFLVNSSVAYGSNDWDDFEQETGTSSPLPSLGAPISRGSNIPADDAMSVNVNRLAVYSVGFSVPVEAKMVEEVDDVPFPSYQQKVADNLGGDTFGFRFDGDGSLRGSDARKDVEDVSVSRTQVGGADDDLVYLENCSVTDVFAVDQGSVEPKPTMEMGMSVVDSGMSQQHQPLGPGAAIGIVESQVPEGVALGDYGQEIGSVVHRSNSVFPVNTLTAESFLDKKNSLTSSNALEKFSPSLDLFEEHPAPVKLDNLDDFYNDVVHEMEEILLDSGESPGARFHKGSRVLQPQSSLPLRDGGSTASTSDAEDTYSLFPHAMGIEGVEVVGAKQKKGDVSLSERLVGVTEFTVYVIRAWCGKKQWEVERRYRDFCTLYRRLKSFFTEQGWILPPPWSAVEKESRKMFGSASPDVIAERSMLIQECLNSVLQSKCASNLPSSLIWFLAPQDPFPSSPSSNMVVSHSAPLSGGVNSEKFSALGKTISLIVEIRPTKPMKQLLELQHYTCAGCHQHFDEGMTLVRDIARSFGWGKPRFCEYTGQLFCSSCHVNETAVIPARVLHQWDFTHYPVSQLAKSYLDSIHDQRMLCVSAVNPLLYTKVPTLQHVMGVRKKIGSMLPFVRCPFCISINKGLGSRRYLLESNDFFALRDLIDLSKGAFAALPAMMETVSNKIQEHIAVQCLICCDVGVPCSARQACDDPSSLIFPFQEGENEKCTSCGQLFHKSCFRKLTACHCGVTLCEDKGIKPATGTGSEQTGVLSFLGRKRSGTDLSVSSLSGLFPKRKPQQIKEQTNSENIILMGSLPGSSILS